MVVLAEGFRQFGIRDWRPIKLTLEDDKNGIAVTETVPLRVGPIR
jgi:hypothetical protein